MSTNATDIQKRIDKEREERLRKARQVLIDAEKNQGLFGAGILPAFPGIFGDTPDDSPGFVGTNEQKEKALLDQAKSGVLDAETPEALAIRPSAQAFTPKESPYGEDFVSEVQRGLFGKFVPAGDVYRLGEEVIKLKDIPLEERSQVAEDLAEIDRKINPGLLMSDAMKTATQPFSYDQQQKLARAETGNEFNRILEQRPVKNLMESTQDYNSRLDAYTQRVGKYNQVDPIAVSRVYDLDKAKLRDQAAASTSENALGGISGMVGLLGDIMMMQSLLDNKPQAPAASAPRGIAGSKLPEEDPFKRRF